jgi:hypothetical protein
MLYHILSETRSSENSGILCGGALEQKAVPNPEILSAHVGTFFHRFAGFKKGRRGSFCM